MAKNIYYVVDAVTKTVIGAKEYPRCAHGKARRLAEATGNELIVLKPVASYKRSYKKKRFK